MQPTRSHALVAHVLLLLSLLAMRADAGGKRTSVPLPHPSPPPPPPPPATDSVGWRIPPAHQPQRPNEQLVDPRDAYATAESPMSLAVFKAYLMKRNVEQAAAGILRQNMWLAVGLVGGGMYVAQILLRRLYTTLRHAI